MKEFFGPDGTVVTVLTKCGQLIFATVLWLICCIPVITIVPATTSFYYTVIKSIRRDSGYVAKEFFRSMKRTVLKGMLISIVCLIIGAGIWFGRQLALARSEEGVNTLLWVYNLLAVIGACILVCFIPVFSRFENTMVNLIKLSFVMAFRYFYISLPLAFGVVFVGWLIFMKLPMLTILVIPGAFCYLATFPVEHMLKAYMPPASEDEREDEWYRQE